MKYFAGPIQQRTAVKSRQSGFDGVEMRRQCNRGIETDKVRIVLVVRQSARMCSQIAQGDGLPRGIRQLGKDRRYLLIRVHQTLVDQPREQRRGNCF